jgi:hypothetical protein
VKRRLSDLPQDVQTYLLSIARAYMMAPTGGWAAGRLSAVLDEETRRYSVHDGDLFVALYDTTKAIVDADEVFA